MSIFEQYIIATEGEDVYNTLELFSIIYKRLDISLEDYSDEIYNEDPVALYESFVRILLIVAQKRNIIPKEWDLYEWFNFSFDSCGILVPEEYTHKDIELVEEVKKKFEDWCDVELEIIYN